MDFGESKDANIQTQTLTVLIAAHQFLLHRNFIARGLVANATLEELKRINIWAFLMLMCCLLKAYSGPQCRLVSPNIAKYRPVSPNVTQYRLLLPNIAYYYLTSPNTAYVTFYDNIYQHLCR